MKPTPEQENVISKVCDLNSVVLTGKAGTGKTYVVNSAKKELDIMGVKHASLSFTASSSKLIGGNTIHSHLLTHNKMLPLGMFMSKEFTKVKGIVENVLKSLSDPSKAKKNMATVSLMTHLATTQVFFIDEISMISPELLYALMASIEISKRSVSDPRFKAFIAKDWCKDISGIDKVDLESVSPRSMPAMVMTGDFFQIPPIAQAPTDHQSRKRGRDEGFSNSEFQKLNRIAIAYSNALSSPENDLNATFAELEKEARASIREDLNLDHFTLPMLKQMGSSYSTWVLRSIRDTRFIFDSFRDLVGTTVTSRSPYSTLKDRCGLIDVTLEHPQRQATDELFVDVLNCLRMGGFCVWNPRNAEYIHPDMRSSGKKPPSWPQHLKNALKKRVGAPSPSSAVRIYLRNVDALTYNKSRLEEIAEPTSSVSAREFYVKDYGKKSETRTAIESVEQSKVEVVKEFINTFPHECRDREPFEFKHGAKVIVTRNLDKENNIVNGTTGVVTDHSTTSVQIETNDGQRHWIDTCETVHHLGGRDYYCIRYTPLILGWAITTCRCQGMTLPAVEIHLSLQYTCGHLYTCVSRVSTLDSLSIVLPVAKSSGKSLPLDFFMDTQAFACHPINFARKV